MNLCVQEEVINLCYCLGKARFKVTTAGCSVVRVVSLLHNDTEAILCRFIGLRSVRASKR